MTWASVQPPPLAVPPPQSAAGGPVSGRRVSGKHADG
eukprot:CAMPEP_0172581476 /NCGR_PEP_ID=MMETSP1068-20121228/679_1 /TAXON_ID=35684 /ORGANISM="Pseudopedinella elastica, Strain CCMP716" /LENGTH=36 /DNA_ID= /DNA_START= /DNA_END= /DNA_ORIENTATION=